MEVKIKFESLEMYLGEKVVMEYTIVRSANNLSDVVEPCKALVQIIGVTPTAVFVHHGYTFYVEREHFISAKMIYKDTVVSCPVCFGRSVVLAEFYDDSAGKGKVDCRSCNGKGYIVL